MRILATLVLAAMLASLNPAKAAGENMSENQAKQTLETKNTISFNDNFLVALYSPKVASTRFSKMYQNKLLSNSFVLPKGSFVANASAYTAAADECGKSDGKISIEGMGTYVCEDRGGAIKGNHFDIYMPTKSEAFAFGRKNLVAMVVE